jgi:hypothetical protein
MFCVSIARGRVNARVGSAPVQGGSRPDPLPYGLVFDVDSVSAVMIRPAARPVIADFAPRPDLQFPVPPLG